MTPLQLERLRGVLSRYDTGAKASGLVMVTAEDLRAALVLLTVEEPESEETNGPQHRLPYKD